MISRWLPALALVGAVFGSGCVIRTGEAVDHPHHHKSPPPPPAKKKAEKREEKREEKKEERKEEKKAEAEEKWEKLGEATVNGKNDHDIVKVGKSEGRFRAVKLVVTGADVTMQDVVVHFVDGSRFSPETRLEFKEGTRSRTIDLPGDRRAIKSVNFRYSDGRSKGTGQVEVWGL